VHIRATHDRQDFDAICAHALEREIESLIDVNVRKLAAIDDLA
jgi:hypothetical protein